jgi:WD40 repeat protein
MRGLAVRLLQAAICGFVAMNVAAQTPEPPSPKAAESALQQLLQRANDPNSDKVKLWDDLVEFHFRAHGTPDALRAAELLSRIPSPLDKLDPKLVPDRQSMPWLQKETVAVVGESAGRQWESVEHLQYTANGDTLVSSGRDLIYFWDAKTLAMKFVLPDFGTFAISPNGQWLVTAGKMRLWNLAKNDKPFVALEDEEASAVTFSRDGAMFVARCKETGIKAWAVNDGKPQLLWKIPIEQSAGADDRLILTPLANRLIARIHPSAVHVWDLTTRPPKLDGTIGIPLPPAAPIPGATPKPPVTHDWQALALTPKGDTLIVGRVTRNAIEFWDLTKSPPKHMSEMAFGKRTVWDGGRVDCTSKAALMSDGSLLAVTLRDRGLALVPLSAKGRDRIGLRPDEEKLVLTPSVPVNALAFTPDDRALTIGGLDGAIRVLAIADGKIAELNAPRYHTGPLQFADWTRDGKGIISGGCEQRVIWWDLAGGKPQVRYQKEFAMHPTLLNSGYLPRGGQLFWLPDGKTAITDVVEKWPMWEQKSRRKERDYLRLEFSNQIRATEFSMPGQFVEHYAVSPGGRFAAGLSVHSLPGGKRFTEMILLEYQGDNYIVRDKLRILQSKSTREEDEEEDDIPSWWRKPLFAPNGLKIALLEQRGQKGDRVRFFDLVDGKLAERSSLGPLAEEDGVRPSIHDIAFAPEMKTIALASDTDHVRLWDYSGETPKELRRIRFPSLDPTHADSLAFSPDGKNLAWRVWEPGHIAVVIYNFATDSFLNKWYMRAWVPSPNFAPDSRHLLIAETNGIISVLRAVPLTR